jgi:hypothetical protein
VVIEVVVVVGATATSVDVCVVAVWVFVTVTVDGLACVVIGAVVVVGVGRAVVVVGDGRVVSVVGDDVVDVLVPAVRVAEPVSVAIAAPFPPPHPARAAAARKPRLATQARRKTFAAIAYPLASGWTVTCPALSTETIICSGPR